MIPISLASFPSHESGSAAATAGSSGTTPCVLSILGGSLAIFLPPPFSAWTLVPFSFLAQSSGSLYVIFAIIGKKGSILMVQVVLKQRHMERSHLPHLPGPHGDHTPWLWLTSERSYGETGVEILWHWFWTPSWCSKCLLGSLTLLA